eukprot:8188375-Lingulodinium_polyedra.AAC.1
MLEDLAATLMHHWKARRDRPCKQLCIGGSSTWGSQMTLMESRARVFSWFPELTRCVRPGRPTWWSCVGHLGWWWPAIVHQPAGPGTVVGLG